MGQKVADLQLPKVAQLLFLTALTVLQSTQGKARGESNLESEHPLQNPPPNQVPACALNAKCAQPDQSRAKSRRDGSVGTRRHRGELECGQQEQWGWQGTLLAKGQLGTQR